MLSEMVKKAREAKGLSQQGLAEAIGRDQSLISRIESGQRTNLTMSTLKALAAGLDLPLMTLLMEPQEEDMPAVSSAG
jgi:transcriptional regulator with XRE-family HTH domain